MVLVVGLVVAWILLVPPLAVAVGRAFRAGSTEAVPTGQDASTV